MKYRTHKIIGAVQIIDEGGRVTGEIRGYAQNDARTIAAAPDLLAACRANQEMRQHILTCPRCADGALCSEFNDLDQRADRLTRAAIAAAENKEA